MLLIRLDIVFFIQVCKWVGLQQTLIDALHFWVNKYRGGTSDATFRRHSLYIIIIIIIFFVVVFVTVVVVNVVGIVFIVVLVV